MSLLKENQEANPEESEEKSMLPPPKTISKKQYDHLAKAREAKRVKAELKQHNNKFFMDQLTSVHQQLGILNTQMGSLITKVDNNMIPPIVGMKRKLDAEQEIPVEPKKVKNEESKKEEEKTPTPHHEDYIPNELLSGLGKFLGMGAAVLAFAGYKRWKEREIPPAEYLYKNIK